MLTKNLDRSVPAKEQVRYGRGLFILFAVIAILVHLNVLHPAADDTFYRITSVAP